MHARASIETIFTIRTCFFDLQLYSATGMWSKTFIVIITGAMLVTTADLAQIKIASY